MDSIKINNKKFVKFLSNKEIQIKVSEIAKKIDEDFKDKNPVILVVLTGSIFFATDLLKDISYDCNIQLISAKSYGDKMESSGKVKIDKHNLNIRDRNVLIIEDIVDTGITLNSILNNLRKMKPLSIKTATLLSKPSKRIVTVDVEYTGFEISDKFVVGYGMDYAEYGRNLQDIYVLEDSNE